MVRLGSSTLRTDTDISNKQNQPSARPRELQPWGAPSNNSSPHSAHASINGAGAFPALGANPGPTPAMQDQLAGLVNALNLTPAQKLQRDHDTFGALAQELNGGAIGQWDQFAENAKLFGSHTDYKEEMYTTTLKKGKGKDWDKKVMRAEELEKEILGGKSNNSHVAEERGQVVDADLDEEDKYSGVKRKPAGNAYVPPALRRLSSNQPVEPTIKQQNGPVPAATAPIKEESAKQDGSAVPQVSVAKAEEDASVKDSTEPVKTVEAPPSKPIIPVLNVTGTETEKKENRAPEKLRTGTPRDSQAIKGDIKGFVEVEKEKLQKQREKHRADQQTLLKAERERKLQELKNFGATFKMPGSKTGLSTGLPSTSQVSSPSNQKDSKPLPVPVEAARPAPVEPATKSKIKMTIPEIPPFQRGGASKQVAQPVTIEKTAAVPVPKVVLPDEVNKPEPVAKLNPGASTFVFKPNPKAADFKPSNPSTVETKPNAEIVSPPSAASVVPRNPFFGAQVPKRQQPVNVRDDFSPFKSKVVDARTIPVNWPFAGKKFASSIMHPTGAYMSAPPPGMEEEMQHFQQHPGGGPLINFAMAQGGPYGNYRVQQQSGPILPGSPQPGMVNGHFAPYGPGFYVQQGGHNMQGGPGTSNTFPQGLPPFANGPNNQSPMMVANAMLRPAGNPMYFVQPPAMSHPASPHPFPSTPQSGIHALAGGPGPGPGPNQAQGPGQGQGQVQGQVQGGPGST